MHKGVIAIAGGGASGSLLAAALTNSSTSAHVVIIEPREELGRGVAYSTDCPRHVLNVPAAKMSAFSAQPDHFVDWLAANTNGAYRSASYVRRSLYGEYLSEIVAQARASATDRWLHIRALARDARFDSDGVRISCSNGEAIDADALVIASGNSAPAAWPRVSPEATRSRRFFRSTWEPNATIPESSDEAVLLLGMGLTAVDAVLALRHNGHRGTIHMVSRRGLLPHEHRVFDSPPAALPDARTVSELLDSMRTIARDMKAPGSNWRGIMDAVRPRTNALWTALSIEEQHRFLRHALSFWNVHRHRIAPEPAQDIAELIASRSVHVHAGRTGPITTNASTLRVPITLRGTNEVLTLDVGRVINCSGPQHDFRKLSNPLIENLLARGVLDPNPLGIGVRVAENGALIGADGTRSNRLYAIGPARFGTLIETTAIPEIRGQVATLTEMLSARFASDRSRLAG